MCIINFLSFIINIVVADTLEWKQLECLVPGRLDSSMTTGYFQAPSELESFLKNENGVKRLEYHNEASLAPKEEAVKEVDSKTCPYFIIFGGMDFSSMFNETLFLTQ